MKLKNIIYLFALSAAFVGCAQESNVVDNADGKLSIKLNLSQVDASIDSRSTDPMDIDKENKMYNLSIVEYSAAGVMQTATKQNFTIDNGALSTTYTATNLVADDNGYIFVVANLPSNYATNWPQNFSQLTSNETDTPVLMQLPITSRNTLSSVSSTNTGIYNSNMYMVGYYHGKIDGTTKDLNIVMSRMATCAKLVLKSTEDLVIESVKIDNAPMMTHYLPSAFSSKDLALSPYTSYTDDFRALTVKPSVTSTSPATLYYYMAENMNPAADKYTTATITASTGATQTTTYSYTQVDNTYTIADVTSIAEDEYYSPRYKAVDIKGKSGYYKYYFAEVLYTRTKKWYGYSKYTSQGRTGNYVGSNSSSVDNQDKDI